MDQEKNNLGRYFLAKKIATGGMAEVYRAKLVGIEGFEKDFAVKCIHPHWSSNRDFIEMMVDEAKILLHLNHANIVQVNELNKENDRYYLVMEYVEGLDLRHLLYQLKKEAKSLDSNLALYILEEILKGLCYAHEKKDRFGKPLKIIHRDISPQNILVSFDGHVKLTDFGIAKAIGKTQETATGVLKGKFAYMSPEQALGQEIDQRSDIFALGIVFYEMLAGKKCFHRSNDLETLEAVKNSHIDFDTIDPVGEQSPIVDLLKKALQKDKKERFQSAREFLNELYKVKQKLGIYASALDLEGMIKNDFSHLIENKVHENQEVNQAVVQVKKDLTQSQLKPKTKVFSPDQLKVQTQKTHLASQTIIHEPTMMQLPDQSNHQFQQQSSRFKKNKSALGVVLFILISLGVGYYFWQPFKAPPKDFSLFLPLPLLVGALPVQNIPKPEPTPTPEPTPKPEPAPKPKPYQVSLNLKAQPKEAPIKIRFQGQEKRFKHQANLSLETLEPITFQVTIDHFGYREFSTTYTLGRQNPAINQTIELEKKPTGTLSVVARPWGYTTVSNIVRGQQTNFRRSVPVGSYTITVSHPGFKKTVSTRAVVREGRRTHCGAKISQAGGTISCNER